MGRCGKQTCSKSRKWKKAFVLNLEKAWVTKARLYLSKYMNRLKYFSFMFLKCFFFFFFSAFSALWNVCFLGAPLKANAFLFFQSKGHLTIQRQTEWDQKFPQNLPAQTSHSALWIQWVNDKPQTGQTSHVVALSVHKKIHKGFTHFCFSKHSFKSAVKFILLFLSEEKSPFLLQRNGWHITLKVDQ